MEFVAASSWFWLLLELVLVALFLIVLIRFGIGVVRQSRRELGEVDESLVFSNLWKKKWAVVGLVVFLVVVIVFPMENTKWRPKTNPNDQRDSVREEQIDRGSDVENRPAVVPYQDKKKQELEEIQKKEEQGVQDIKEQFKSLPDAKPKDQKEQGTDPP